MNKRIRELAEQADIVFGHYNNNEVICSAIDITKFAELIVRECISKIENEAAQYAEPVWAVELVNDIKEHFGVES